MSKLIVESNDYKVATHVASLTYKILKDAIKVNDQACWIIAGGSSPFEAYKEIVDSYKDKLNWRKVFVGLGDERLVKLGSDESNWYQISKILLDKLPFSKLQLMNPLYDQDSLVACKDYEQKLRFLPDNEDGIPRIDLLYLGLGEDGHTLSLFPGQVNHYEDKLVVVIHNAPKLPAERISLTLKALQNVQECLVITSGNNKAEIIRQVFNDNLDLPIVQAIKTIEDNGGNVSWIIDQPAASLLN